MDASHDALAQECRKLELERDSLLKQIAEKDEKIKDMELEIFELINGEDT